MSRDLNGGWTVVCVTLIICVSIGHVLGYDCPSLSARSGVELICEEPQTGKTISCETEVPSGTVAKFNCKMFYSSPSGDSEGGKLICNSNGKWSRSIQFEDFVCRVDCGKSTASLGDKSPVVVFGEVAARENFPWHAAIFRNDGPGTEFYFFCGGSLISPSNKGFIILTAAHCATNSLRTQRARPVGDFKVVLGAVSSDLNVNANTEGVQIHTVKASKIHPKYNFDLIQNDVALMKLGEKINLTKYVSPVCFPTSDMANMQVSGTGEIPGFGVDQSTRISTNLNFAKLPVTENYICNFALGKQLTSIEFCAGYESGSSICSGDSGGGLVFKDDNDRSNKFYIQGIASNVDRRPLQNLNYCQNYNTFTRVSSFVDWIQDQMDTFFFDDVESDDDRKKRPGGNNRPPQSVQSGSGAEFRVTVYKDIKHQETFVEWRMRNCSAVPRNWNSGIFWIDIHGKCLQFFEGTYCSGKSLQLQSTPESSIFKWDFPSFRINSVNICKNPASGSNNIPTSGNGNANQSSGSNNSGSNSGNDYEKVVLKMHNLYRSKHGVAPVTLNETLSRDAQRYAQELLRRGYLQTSGDGGENLFEITGSSGNNEEIAKQAVDLWYNTNTQYDYNNPSATSFSQLVWRSTKEIGMGLASSGRKTVIVARYSPPGNVYFNGGGDRVKFFRENVFPPRK